MDKIKQAALHLQQGKLQEAEAIYREILAERPDHGIALWGLGRIAMAVGHTRGAIPLLSRAAQSLSDKPEPLLDLGEVLGQCGRHADAGAAYQLAVERGDSNVRCAVALGAHYTVMGRPDAATAEFRRALDLDHTSAEAWAGLSRVTRFAAGSAEIQAMETLLQRHTVTDGERLLLHYALGEQLHVVGDYHAAFEHWQQGNILDRARCSFGVAAMAPFFEGLRGIFDAELCLENASADRSTAGLPSAETSPLTPIFIVGQPRSGSTLLEQMLSCHSTVEAAGEVRYLGRDVANALRQMTGKPFPEGCAETTAEQRQELAQLYLARLQEHAPGARYITDKLPANYQSIGWIRMLMPQARIIHLRREPMALCFSIFRNHFRAAEPFFATLQEIGRYQGYYQAMMAHWDSVLPGFVHSLDYEALVAEPEATLRGVLEFCGLDWEPQCLDFQRNPRPVATLSNTAVREPLAQGRDQEWRHYAEQLGPLRDVLGLQ